MNPKIQKVTVDIEKTQARIADAQARLKELEQQKLDLENTEIVNLFRSVDVAPADLAGFIRVYKEKGLVIHAAPQPEYRPANGYGYAAPDKEEDESDE